MKKNSKTCVILITDDQYAAIARALFDKALSTPGYHTIPKHRSLHFPCDDRCYISTDPPGKWLASQHSGWKCNVYTTTTSTACWVVTDRYKL